MDKKKARVGSDPLAWIKDTTKVKGKQGKLGKQELPSKQTRRQTYHMEIELIEKIKTELEELKQTAFDSDAVKQIVVNLLDNAIKYARNAEDKTITLRTKSNSQFIFIEVEDHGPGVPHRQRKKIFEEFYRTEAEATRETTGTGLGLALVKKFAQAHNGFVEILTAKPAGAIFRVGLAVQS